MGWARLVENETTTTDYYHDFSTVLKDLFGFVIAGNIPYLIEIPRYYMLL